MNNRAKSKKIKCLKIAHVYTVRREFSIKPSELESEIETFGGVKDECGEHLYGGTGGTEEISVEMQVLTGKLWKTVGLDPL